MMKKREKLSPSVESGLDLDANEEKTKWKKYKVRQ